MSFNAQPEIAKPQRSWSVFLAFIGVLLAGMFILLGVTSANLAVEKAELPTKHDVHSSEVSFDANYTGDTGTISALLDLGSPSTLTLIKVKNDGNISQNLAWGVDAPSLTGIDLNNPMYSQTRVSVNISTDTAPAASAVTDRTTYTLKQFLTEVFISDQVIAPGATAIFAVTVLPATESEWNTIETTAALNQKFGTRFTASQIKNGTTPLVDYAKTNGTPLFQETGIKAWTIPAADLPTIAL